MIQVWITPRIHRYLGIGFALLILPTNLGATAGLIILNKVALGPGGGARHGSVAPLHRRQDDPREFCSSRFRRAAPEAKPFVDVTVDRLSRGLAALLMLVLIQPWGLDLAW